jgi:hypothetical protein
MSTDEQRQAIIAASGSGGSARYVAPQLPGQLKFGESVFGGTDATLKDDDGNPLVAKTCPLSSCVGSHVWIDGEHVRCYCAGPPQ